MCRCRVLYVFVPWCVQVSEGLRSLSQRIIGSNTLVQGALPVILRDTPRQFFEDTIAQVQVRGVRG